MTTDVDEFLNHVGVKGMHWGVRKAPSKRTAEAEARRKTIKRVAIGAGVIGVAAVAATMIARSNQKVPLARIDSFKFGKHGETFLNNAMKSHGNVKVSDIPKPKTMSSHAKLIESMTNKQNRLIREANADLRKKDNLLQIPFAQRSYLQEWGR